MLTLAQLAEKFPTVPLRHNMPGCMNKPITGRIPIAYFTEHESEILKARKESRLPTRAVFRGPRPSQYAQDTRREDAVSAVIYSR
jgi:hypothetical protein